MYTRLAVPGADRSDSWQPHESQMFHGGSQGHTKRQQECQAKASNQGIEGGASDSQPENKPENKPKDQQGASCSKDDDCAQFLDCKEGERKSCKKNICQCELDLTCAKMQDCDAKIDCAQGNERFCDKDTCRCRKREIDLKCIKTRDCEAKMDCADKGNERFCDKGTCKCREPLKEDLGCTKSEHCQGKIKCSGDHETSCKEKKCECVEKPPEQKAPAFKSGTCNAHIWQGGGGGDFFANITLYDGAGMDVGHYHDTENGDVSDSIQDWLEPRSW